ncbi:UV-B-induced protein, chloroplastic-like isoform X2 [Salvia divinorum]|uniref:UV-B-induced protein, chloroplastic-like isoform X2 n=1 Tax=Salvia divinorum TaxID=28513 RepID=A0ABD1GKD0_SALDI
MDCCLPYTNQEFPTPPLAARPRGGAPAAPMKLSSMGESLSSDITNTKMQCMLIFYKFSEIGVNLVPWLSQCAYNGRLEILPSKDWELESIHSAEVLQMVREHLTAVIGCRVKYNVTDSWATTETASLRYQFERSLDISSSHYGLAGRGQHPVSEMFTLGSSYIAHGRVSSPRSTPAKSSFVFSGE